MNRAAVVALAGVGVLLGLYAYKTAQANINGQGAAVAASPDGTVTSSIDLTAGLYGVQNMIAGRHISASGLVALETREGLSLTVYNDTAGLATIGYGHRVKAGEDFTGGISQAQAADLLAQDVAYAEDAVSALVSVALDQAQFDALVSFTYNAGVSAFKNSTLLKLLNAGDYQGAADQMTRWVFVTRGGVKVADAGLSNRRASEQRQFLA